MQNNESRVEERRNWTHDIRGSDSGGVPSLYPYQKQKPVVFSLLSSNGMSTRRGNTTRTQLSSHDRQPTNKRGIQKPLNTRLSPPTGHTKHTL